LAGITKALVPTYGMVILMGAELKMALLKSENLLTQAKALKPSVAQSWRSRDVLC